MRYLVCANTPAHVHVYKHAVRRLRKRGHAVRILARDYQCTVPLLDHYDLPYEVYGRCGSSKLSLLRELPRQYRRLLPAARRFDPDLVFGMGSYAAHAGAVTRTPTVLLLDSEHHGLDHAIAHPFADALLTPHAFRKDLGPRHYRFRGFKECAYLHPNVFSADPRVRADLGVGPDEPLAIARFNAFGSHHDVGESGFTPRRRRELLDRLTDHATVVVSAEDDVDTTRPDVRAYDLHPARLHDALAAADLLVADTATVVTEAALLGTPAVRTSSFVGDDDFGNFHELERVGLVSNLESFDAVLDRATELLSDGGVQDRWATRREEYVAELADLTELVVEVALDGGDVSGVDRLVRGAPPTTPA
jgi:predicted glycosyltransferase